VSNVLYERLVDICQRVCFYPSVLTSKVIDGRPFRLVQLLAAEPIVHPASCSISKAGP